LHCYFNMLTINKTHLMLSYHILTGTILYSGREITQITKSMRKIYMLFWLNVDTIVRPKGKQLLQQQRGNKCIILESNR
jgi:hypothetical protein